MNSVGAATLTYQRRLDALRVAKLQQTREKQGLVSMDEDDHGLILPPPEARELVETVGGSGNVIRDVLIKGFKPQSNHPSGGFFGPKAVGENFRRLLEIHPTYIDPMSSLVSRYMVNFLSYRQPHWKPEFDYSHLHSEQKKYGIHHGIGGVQHFCPDLTIGLELGWGGLLAKVRRYRKVNPHATDFYDGLEEVILGMQNWIGRHAEAARQMAGRERSARLRENLEAIADICERLVTDPPQTLREACQWLGFFQSAAKMYNSSGEWGQLDELLRPYYERDTAGGILTDEEAIFHIACLLLIETAYIQLGGPDARGNDLTSPVSYLILEAVHRSKTPANIAIRVGDGLDPNLLRRGVEILFDDKMGLPKFLGDKPVNEGFVKNGYPLELARQRIYAGCHWLGIPGREYTLNDCVKINFACVFDVALREMMADPDASPSVAELWSRFKKHLRRAVEVTAEGLDIHLEHMHEVFPELYLDLFCYGPIEKGLDASHGGVEYYNMCVDGAALATVADSFAGVEQRVEREGRLTWDELMYHLDNDFQGAEDIRLMLNSIPRYGTGGSRADGYAVRISQTFSRLVKEKPTPAGFNMIPGLFSWAATISMGQEVGATPNGRHAYAPISQGANPDPGFPGSCPTALAVAVASVQSGYGNTAPLQLDMDPLLGRDEGGLEIVEARMRGHFASGGTLININVIDKEQILEAHQDPAKYPDLIVRVTGFSAYFASLSEELRQLIVDRIVEGA